MRRSILLTIHFTRKTVMFLSQDCRASCFIQYFQPVLIYWCISEKYSNRLRQIFIFYIYCAFIHCMWKCCVKLYSKSCIVFFVCCPLSFLFVPSLFNLKWIPTSWTSSNIMFQDYKHSRTNLCGPCHLISKLLSLLWKVRDSTMNDWLRTVRLGSSSNLSCLIIMTLYHINVSQDIKRCIFSARTQPVTM